MKRKHFRFGILLLNALWIGVSLLSGIQLSNAYAFSYSRMTYFISVTPTPSAPSSPSPGSFLQFFGSIIGAVAVIVAAIITAVGGGLFIVYQVRKNHRLELEKQQKQF